MIVLWSLRFVGLGIAATYWVAFFVGAAWCMVLRLYLPVRAQSIRYTYALSIQERVGLPVNIEQVARAYQTLQWLGVYLFCSRGIFATVFLYVELLHQAKSHCVYIWLAAVVFSQTDDVCYTTEPL